MKKFITLSLLFAFLSANTSFAITDTSVSEHIFQSKKIAKKSPTNLSLVDEQSISVLKYNVIEVSFAQDFSTKTAQVGDKIDFLLNDGLSTSEGTEILPKGTILNATVKQIIKPKSFNRCGKVTINIDKLTTPDGEIMPVEAKLFKKDFLSRNKLNAFGKGMSTTLGAAAIGTGAGCGIGIAAGAVIVGGFAIGLPIALGVGAIAGLVTPGLHYKAKAGDTILIQLTDDLNVAL